MSCSVFFGFLYVMKMSVMKRIVFTYDSGYFYKNLLLVRFLLNIQKIQKPLAKSDKKVYNYFVDYFFERIVYNDYFSS